MCGRLNVTDDPLAKLVSEALDVDIHLKSNTDLSPSQEVATIVAGEGMSQLNTTWGIKPAWSKKLLINAQAETAAEKPTFKKYFAQHRCVVPCSGWYEWSSIGSSKQKFLFTQALGKPLYMAGILYPNTGALAQLVTLTTCPDDQCAPYHHRMPLLIEESSVEDWLFRPSHEVGHLLCHQSEPLNIALCT